MRGNHLIKKNITKSISLGDNIETIFYEPSSFMRKVNQKLNRANLQTLLREVKNLETFS